MSFTARRFTFGDDFRGVPQDKDAERQAAERAAQEEAQRQAFANGVEEGRRQAAAETERRLAEALERLGAEASVGFRQTDALLASSETQAMQFFAELARRLAGSALAEQPLTSVADAALAAFRHLQGVPHLVARVPAPLVEGTETLLRQMARENGFEGRIIVIGDDHLGPGDVRLDWAEGGVVRDRAAFEQAISGALAAFTARPADTSYDESAVA